MLLKLQKNKEFNLIIKKFYKKYREEILDIILFGSTIRGKEKPNDIDILIIFKNKEDLDVSYELRKKLEKFYKTQITSKTYETLLDSNFMARESILAEGYSLIRKEFMANSFAFQNFSLFQYDLKGFSQSRRMQLQYALYGRNTKGIVQELKLIKFANSMFLCPIELSEHFKEFLNAWKIKYSNYPVLYPSRMIPKPL